MAGDHVTNMALRIPAVLKAGVNVLVYSGALDYICNWMGGNAWTQALEWDGKAKFNAAKNTTWTVNGENAGSYLQYENFAFLKVDGAGHQVPQDRPVQAQAMLD
jgi:cathepsin A (carboxypeptidase C)